MKFINPVNTTANKHFKLFHNSEEQSVTDQKWKKWSAAALSDWQQYNNRVANIQAVTASPIIEKLETSASAIEGKHIVKIGPGHWPYYGDPKLWDHGFENAVKNAVEELKSDVLQLPDIFKHFEHIGYTIAFERENPLADDFGLRRDVNTGQSSTNISYTPIKYQNNAYGYALERAVEIPYDEKNFIKSQSDNGKIWFDNYFENSYGDDNLRYGLVQGYLDGKLIPLTQYIFCARTDKYRCSERGIWFGEGDGNYIGEKNESCVWLHTGYDQIPIVLKHIEKLIAKAIDGDLTVVPKIHWWYVHLAPTERGSGGIAEMITNTLCRLHNVNLPSWRDGIAPSVEVLLQPNEEEFCNNYHLLFMSDQEKLKALFKATD